MESRAQKSQVKQKVISITEQWGSMSLKESSHTQHHCLMHFVGQEIMILFWLFLWEGV